MAWRAGKTYGNDGWIAADLSYDPDETGVFSIDSAPTTVLRGSSYTLTCSNVSEAPSAATLGGYAVTITGFTSTSISITIPAAILSGHGTKSLSFTVAGVTRAVSVTFNPQSGRTYIVLVDPVGGAGTVFQGMTTTEGAAADPQTGNELIYQTSTTGNAYPVEHLADGDPVIDTAGADPDGTDTWVIQLLSEGQWISNEATLTLDDYIGENLPPILSSVIPDQSAIAGAAITFDVSGYFSDPDDDVLTFAKTSGDSGLSMNSSTGVLTGSINGAAGSYAITVSADDTFNDPATDTFNIVTSLASPTYAFSNVTGQGLSQSVSAVSDVSAPAGARLEFSGGEISVNGGSSYTSTSPQFVVAGQTRARVTVTTSGSYGTPVTGSMTINGVTRSFTATTGAAPAITLSAVRNVPAQTIALTATASYAASAISFQADTGSGFTTINTDSSAPFAYTYDISAIPFNTTVIIRAIEGSTVSNSVRFRIGGGTRRKRGVFGSMFR